MYCLGKKLSFQVIIIIFFKKKKKKYTKVSNYKRIECVKTKKKWYVYSQLFGNSEEEEEDLQVKDSDKENGKVFNADEVMKSVFMRNE